MTRSALSPSPPTIADADVGRRTQTSSSKRTTTSQARRQLRAAHSAVNSSTYRWQATVSSPIGPTCRARAVATGAACETRPLSIGGLPQRPPGASTRRLTRWSRRAVSRGAVLRLQGDATPLPPPLHSGAAQTEAVDDVNFWPTDSPGPILVPPTPRATSAGGARNGGWGRWRLTRRREEGGFRDVRRRRRLRQMRVILRQAAAWSSRFSRRIASTSFRRSRVARPATSLRTGCQAEE